MHHKKIFSLTGSIAILIGFIFICSIPLNAQELTYREISGENVFHYDYDINKTTEGYKIGVIKRKDSQVIEDQVFYLNKDYHTTKWVYRRPGDDTDVTAVLEGDMVYMNGVSDGDEVEEDEDLDDYPWIQLWPMNIGLEPFMNAEAEEIRYWAYGTEKPGYLKLAKFVATKEGIESIKIDNERYDAYRVKITVSGWRSMFWEGNFFLRKSDWRILMYDGEGAPGKPDSRTTLIAED